jgi:hypothetical protein
MTATGDLEIESFTYAGTTYVPANGELSLGTTSRWWIDTDGNHILWVDDDPSTDPPQNPPPVLDTSNPKGGDVGSKADNFYLRLDGATNISSIDGINYQETVFPFLTDTFFLFERGGNDSGTWQAILEDDTLGTAIDFTAAAVYGNTGVNVGGQNAFGVVFETDVPVKGVRISASGHDTFSISTPAQPQPILFVDLATGEVSMGNNSTSDVQIVGYSIASAAGALDPDGWIPFADSDADWSVTASSALQLAENDAVGGGVTVVSQATPLDLGDAFVPSPFADLQFTYELEGGVSAIGPVSYTGEAPLLGDLDNSGTLDKPDFVIFAANSYTDFRGESALGAYLRGDLDFDLDNDFDDFTIFRDLYIAANGVAAFNNLLVPEPSAMALISSVIAAGILGLRRRMA